MTFYQKLERRFGKYAVPNLMKYICVIYVVGYLIQMFNPLLYFYYLDLDAEAILHGHIWRIITFIFYPPSTSFLWMIVALFVYYSLGMTLERVWGTFKYNFFYFTGVILLVLAAILIYLVTGYSVQLYPTYMTFSIFLAYALTFPETTFLLYFIIPIKAKWLAIAEVVLYLFYFVALPGLGNKVAILVSLLNVALFFLLTNQRPKNRNIYNMRDFR
ncbi:hypothetical protein [Oribacterium sp. P9]|uniref:hypothetical protein n=1 Tax=unclassified Oribacterium TaxID=2629782 RepID=UPI002A7D0C8F|nr:hypothetical protein [Oribacterium sp.]MDD6520000.1 hypothetical protein [Oribacterium sp.]MDY2854133.1 hypothetical protein [Oliverpabstia sp.]